MKAAMPRMVKRSRTKSRGLKGREAGLDTNQLIHEMCLIHRDFKQSIARKAKDSQERRKDSSIMWAKVLSIMRGSDLRLTSLFKPIPTGLGYGLIHRPGT